MLQKNLYLNGWEYKYTMRSYWQSSKMKLIPTFMDWQNRGIKNSIDLFLLFRMTVVFGCTKHWFIWNTIVEDFGFWYHKRITSFVIVYFFWSGRRSQYVVSKHYLIHLHKTISFQQVSCCCNHNTIYYVLCIHDLFNCTMDINNSSIASGSRLDSQPGCILAMICLIILKVDAML